MAGRVKESLPGHSLKYQFVYLKIRLFKCSYRNMKLGSTLIWKTDATIGIGHITHIHFRLWYHGCSCLEWTRFQFQWTSKHGPIELRHVIQPKNQPEQVPRYWWYWSYWSSWSSQPTHFMAGWWFGTWILWLSIQLGMSSSQLTNSIIFRRGRWLNHQPARINHYELWTIMNHH